MRKPFLDATFVKYVFAIAREDLDPIVDAEGIHTDTAHVSLIFVDQFIDVLFTNAMCFDKLNYVW
jgi:hypothetical protein